jgi:putative addiction module killer protein
MKMNTIADLHKEKFKATAVFNNWVAELPSNVYEKVSYYINRVIDGNYSNCKSVGNGVREIKIDYQKGYRVYFTTIDNAIILLLAGGDKKRQNKDIQKAIAIRNDLKTRRLI